MTGLLLHVGGVHGWVEHIVSTRSAAYVKRETEEPDGPEATLAWFEQGATKLLETLRATDPDEPVWNWFDRAPAPARFWFRRMAHETAVHRWDGEAGAGEPGPIAPDLAVDGIDEFLGFVGLWLSRQPVADLKGSLHLHATDTDGGVGEGGGGGGEWSIDLWPDRIEHRREHSKADAAIRGPVSDLQLWMVNRIPADSPRLQLFGNRAIIDSWRQLQF
ncbi:MAG: hypothetical protein QOK20_2631 [Acidimicrobiaceae bacterium]|nr:hypothetical protein [Acidimicrobiaceae bacterium]